MGMDMDMGMGVETKMKRNNNFIDNLTSKQTNHDGYWKG